MSSEIRICASGDLWVGGGIGSLETALHQLLMSAEDKVLIACYSVTPGANALLSELSGVLERGVLVRMIVNRFEKQNTDARVQLRGLSTKFRHFELWDFTGPTGTDLHAKVLCADGRQAVIGSSNLSFRGLVSNYELGVKISGETARAIEERVLAIFSSRHASRVA
jgi:cardiolipin synthase